MTTKSEKKTLVITALGGLHEQGKNLFVLETSENEILILDAGVLYPGHDSPGVDYIFPEYQYLINKVAQIKGLVLSSAHDYHCGGAHHLISKCNIKKVMGSKLALSLVKAKLSPEFAETIEWQEFASRKEIQVSQFKVIPFSITSSNVESYACYIEANGSKIFYSGNFKLDQTPTDGVKTDMVGITSVGSIAAETGEGIDLYIGDSLNSEKEGYTKSELEIYPKLKSMIESHKGRVIINTCNSNTVRIQNLFNIAELCGRKISLLNREAREIVKALNDSDCLDYNEENLVSIKDILNYDDKDLLILCTAPEGDAIRELEEIGFDRSLEIQLKEGDMVMNSADLSPGTVRTMAKISDEFFLKEVKIVGGREAGIHADTHAASEELKFMFNLVRPKHFIPGIGETRQLIKHAQLAVDSGFDPGSIFIIDNGDQVELSNKNLTITGHIDTGNILFNDSQDFHVDTKIVKERENLAKEGVVTVCFSISKKKKVVSGPVFSARACTFSNNKEWRAFCLMNSQDIIDAIEVLGEEKPRSNIDDYQNLVRDHMNNIIKNQIGKKPSVIVLASEV